MKRLGSTIATATGLILSANVAAMAQAPAGPASRADPYVERVFARPVGNGKVYACFVRRYDAQHLELHPKQKVTGMKVLVAAETDAEDGSLRFSFQMGVTFRGRRQTFESAGHCYHPDITETEDGPDRIGCGVDCDGGGLGLALTNNDKSVLVSLEEIRIWRRNDNGEDSPRFRAGADDKRFRLDRTKLIDCGSLAEDRKELAALRRQ